MTTRREIIRRIRRGLRQLDDQPEAVELVERDWMDGDPDSFIEAESWYRLEIVADEIERIVAGSKATQSAGSPTSKR